MPTPLDDLVAIGRFQPYLVDLEAFEDGRIVIGQNETLDDNGNEPTAGFPGIFRVLQSGAWLDLYAAGAPGGVWETPTSANTWITGHRDGNPKAHRLEASTLVPIADAPGGIRAGYSVSPHHAIIERSDPPIRSEYCNGIWTDTTVMDYAVAFWGSAPDNYYSVGYAGDTINDWDDPVTISHWDGSAWSTVLTADAGRLNTIWGANANDIWAGGRRTEGDALLYHYDGASWAEVPLPYPPDSGWSEAGIHQIRGNGARDVLFAGREFVLHWDGSTLRELTRSVAPADLFDEVWGSGNEVFVRGPLMAGNVLHTTLVPGQPEVWSRETICTNCDVTAIAGLNGDAWAVATKGATIAFFKRSNGTWIEQPYASPFTFSKMYSLLESAGTLWAMGDGGRIYRYDGNDWSERFQTSGGRDFWTNGIEVWLARPQTGPALHWDGNAWTSWLDPSVVDVFGRSATEVYLLQDIGVIWRWNGATLEQYATLPGNGRAAAIDGDATHLWVAFTSIKGNKYYEVTAWLDSGTGFQQIAGPFPWPHPYFGHAYFTGAGGAIERGIIAGQGILGYRP